MCPLVHRRPLGHPDGCVSLGGRLPKKRSNPRSRAPTGGRTDTYGEIKICLGSPEPARHHAGPHTPFACPLRCPTTPVDLWDVTAAVVPPGLACVAPTAPPTPHTPGINLHHFDCIILIASTIVNEACIILIVSNSTTMTMYCCVHTCIII